VKPEVLRGGSWNNNQENARCANRNNNNPNNRNNNIGFRLSRTWVVPDALIFLVDVRAWFFMENRGVRYLSPGFAPVLA
jgi:hypothetical protein